MNSEEKLEYIFSELGKGVDREKISDKLGYKTFKSMDNFVRRKNYTWNDGIGNYEGDQSNILEDEMDSSVGVTGHHKELLDYLLAKEKILKQLLDEKETIGADGGLYLDI